MKFSSNLTAATLLKRSIKFLANIVLANGQKIIIRCPNLKPMLGCDILGTKLWYSTAVGYHYLPTWEIAEVDGGHLVGINPEILKPLVIEAIKLGIITEFTDCQLLPIANNYETNNQQWLTLEKNQQKYYLCLEHLTLGNEQNAGIFPETPMETSNIKKLIALRQAGHQAILFFCVMHTGLQNINLGSYIDPNYTTLLAMAINAGVQLLAYKASISPEEIKFTTKLPICYKQINNQMSQVIQIKNLDNTTILLPNNTSNKFNKLG